MSHITCHNSYTCILRYLSATHQVHQKCPLCADHFSRSALKPVKFNTMVVPNLALSTGTGGGGGGGGGGGREFEKRKYKDREKEKERNGERERERERRGSELEEGEGEGEAERELKGDSYTLQLLFVEKDSLFPTLPVLKIKKNDVNSSSSSSSGGGGGNEGNKNQKSNLKSKKSSPPYHVPTPSSCPLLHRPVSSITTLSECSLVPLNTEARGRFSRIITVSIEGCLVAMEEERSMLLAYRQECLDSGCGTGSVYDEAAFNLTDSNTGTGSASQGQGQGQRQGQGHVEEGSSSSSAVGARSRSNSCWGSPHTVSTAAADTLLSKMIHMQQQQQLQQQQRNLEQLHLQGDTEYLPAINEALMLLLEKEEAFRDKCAKLGIQAILTSASFRNIREAEACMELKLLESRNSVNPDVMKEIVIDKRKERDKDREKEKDFDKGKKIEKEKEKDKDIDKDNSKDKDRHIAPVPDSEIGAVAGTGTGTVRGAGTGTGLQTETKALDDKSRIGYKFSLSASSVPFVPSFALLSTAQPPLRSPLRSPLHSSSLPLPLPLPVPASATSVPPCSSASEHASAFGVQLSSLASASSSVDPSTDKVTSIHSRPPPLPTSDHSLSLSSVTSSTSSSSTHQEDETALTTVLPTLLQPTPSFSSSSSSLSTKYHMFQSPHGDLIFLHPLCTKCLLASVHNDVTHLPYTVTSSVLEIEILRVSAAMKTRIPFLRYLPDYCQVVFIELDMRGLVTTDAWNAFKEEFVRRAKKRKEKDKITKKEKKQKDDEM